MNVISRAVAAALFSAAAMGAAAPAAAQASAGVIKIGFITDMSGIFADIDGAGGVEAIRMAIADFGGTVLGKKIELLVADHQNKADIAANKAREWIDQQGIDMIAAGTNSSANLSIAKIASEKKRPFLALGGMSARLSNEDCTPYTVQYAVDTVALARGTGGAMMAQGGKTWFFLTADYAFGHSLEKDTTEVIKDKGGTVLGSVKYPLAAADFSSFLLQALGTKAEVLGLASGSGDNVNAIKGAREFGLTRNMKLAGLLMFINDTHSLGLDTAQGMYLTEGWYWDQSPESRAWAKRFFEKMKKMPSLLQAGDYSATMHYLKAVKAAGTVDADKVMAKMRELKVNDMFARNGVVRPDGRMVYDLSLMQIKSPGESKYPWDYYKMVQKISGDQAFTTKTESKCSLWK